MFKQLNNATAKPVAWSSYTAAVLCADPHIARQMMAYHLNPDINAASRSFDFIDESVSWLISSFGLNQSSTVIDFGCGPGLYTQRLKKQGTGTVVGLDFSQNSLEYASQQADRSNLDIEYHLGNYLDYWCIQSSFLYRPELVTLDKYVICEEEREWTVYNWLQYFTLDMLRSELEQHGLEIQATYSDLRGRPWTDGDEIAVVIGLK
ncbi:class I SAM-dependent methyltransferase [Endozoicomonas sp. ALB091]|uniref:class I SAM-dependent methyltransferase n=1 Tax=Endozoicomonas sp. ALB091 TaxID=3403073 RepID=UPI003BB73D03